MERRNHSAHGQDHDRYREAQTNPELERKITNLFCGVGVVDFGTLRFERHSADRAIARPIASNLRVHWAGIDLCAREERDVLKGLVDGLSYKQVADRLGISENTVRTHIRGLYRKLQVQNVAEAVSRAVREQLV